MNTRFGTTLVLAAVLISPVAAEAQGVINGAEHGAAVGHRAAGPVGGAAGAVVGGVAGGVVGGVRGVLGLPQHRFRGPVSRRHRHGHRR